jgi:parvulin-like peptidyl-prolyl isomerase
VLRSRPSSLARRSVSPSAFALLLLFVVTVAAGCGDAADAPDYAARVGDQYLRPAEVTAALDPLPPGADSVAARRQVIRQWTNEALLYREAQRRGLADDSAVSARLEASRRSVLVNALIGRLYDEASASPSSEAMRTYFERHRKALRLSQPHVRVRHLSTAAADDARAARRRLREALQQPGAADTAWTTLTRRYADDSSRARRLASGLHTEPSLFSRQPAAAERLTSLEKGELAPIFQAGERFHVLQLVERVPTGTLPEFAWVEDEIRRRLVLRHRKQTYARQVERLRSQARADGVLKGGP